jgi:phage-related protein
MFESLSSVITALCEQFMSLYEQWDKKQSRALCKKMLEQDIMTLGFYFAGRDEFGQVAKFSMVCEAVAQARLLDSPINTKRNIDYWIDVVMEELHPYRLTPPECVGYGIEELVHYLQTWRVVREMYQQKTLDLVASSHFKQNIIKVADALIMFDGNVTARELTALKQFEAALTELPQDTWRASSVTFSYMDDEIGFELVTLDNKQTAIL